MADYWLANGMTGKDGPWPNLPFPYNTDVHSGRYDGDMVAGKGFLQPDKAGSFGAELVDLHKITGEPRYLDAAIGIADTLARNVKPGDADHSPWPFRVHAVTGEVFASKNGRFDYTTNWTGALRLFDGLVAMGKGRVADYERARRLVSDWLRAYPVKSQRWGPFFEDINIYSDTQINAGTLALYVLENPGWMKDGVGTVRRHPRLGERDVRQPAVVAVRRSRHERADGLRGAGQQPHLAPGLARAAVGGGSRRPVAQGAGRPEPELGDLHGGHRRQEPLLPRRHLAHRRLRRLRAPLPARDGGGAGARAPRPEPPAADELGRPLDRLRRRRDRVREVGRGLARDGSSSGRGSPGAVEGGTMRWDPRTRVLEVEATAQRVVDPPGGDAGK